MRVYLSFLLVAALGCASAPPARDGQASHISSPSEPPIALSVYPIYGFTRCCPWSGEAILRITIPPHSQNVGYCFQYDDGEERRTCRELPLREREPRTHSHWLKHLGPGETILVADLYRYRLRSTTSYRTTITFTRLEGVPIG